MKYTRVKILSEIRDDCLLDYNTTYRVSFNFLCFINSQNHTVVEKILRPHMKLKTFNLLKKEILTHSLAPKFIYPSSEAEFSCNTCTDHGRAVIVNLGYHTYTSFLQQ